MVPSNTAGLDKVLGCREQRVHAIAAPERPVVAAANDGEVRADAEPGELALELLVLAQ
jgi:hypothetical protein